jgi:hypothetical protein
MLTKRTTLGDFDWLASSSIPSTIILARLETTAYIPYIYVFAEIKDLDPATIGPD